MPSDFEQWKEFQVYLQAHGWLNPLETVFEPLWSDARSVFELEELLEEADLQQSAEIAAAISEFEESGYLPWDRLSIFSEALLALRFEVALSHARRTCVSQGEKMQAFPFPSLSFRDLAVWYVRDWWDECGREEAPNHIALTIWSAERGC